MANSTPGNCPCGAPIRLRDDRKTNLCISCSMKAVHAARRPPIEIAECETDGCTRTFRMHARRKTRLCHPCAAGATGKSEAKRAKGRDAMRNKLRDPNYAAAHRERARRAAETKRQNPVEMARLRASGQLLGLTYGRLGPPAGSPPRIQIGKSLTNTKLGWCPVEYRDLYRQLARKTGVSAKQARKMVQEQIAKDLRSYERTGVLQETVRMEQAA
jgi:hypothetical protein